MKNLLIILSFLFLNCKNTNEIKRKELKLETYLNSLFNDNENWNQNDITIKEFNKRFYTEITTKLNNDILDDFPLKLEEINEYSENKYAAKFSGSYVKESLMQSNSIISNTNFDIIGLINKENLKKLKTNNSYIIKGKFIRFLNDDYQDFIQGMVFTNQVIIHNDLGGPKVNIGLPLFEITEITESINL